jgi:DNA-binding CsgD family transcriptional regulator
MAKKKARREGEESAVERALRERIKELTCLYQVSELIDRYRTSIDDLLQGIVDLLPYSWQYPECACARILLEERKYKTKGFKKTPHKQTADILVMGRAIGNVEVYYHNEMPNSDEGPFLKEERALINAVAERLGRTIEGLRAQQELRRTYMELRVERKALQESNVALREVLARIDDEKEELKKGILANVNKIIMPILLALEAEVGPEQRGFVKLLKRNLEEITSPLTDKLSRRFMSLTPAELRTCNMLRMGLTTKEIAQIRHVAPATVSRQRESIRRKLRLTGKAVNITTFLQTFTEENFRIVPNGSVDPLADTDAR